MQENRAVVKFGGEMVYNVFELVTDFHPVLYQKSVFLIAVFNFDDDLSLILNKWVQLETPNYTSIFFP